MDEKITTTANEELSYIAIFKKIVRILFGTKKPPIFIRIITTALLVIHTLELLLFSLVSIFVLLSPERYYEKSVLEDFSEVGDDFFYAYTLLQVIILAIVLMLWRVKNFAVYLYAIFSFVEILLPYFLVKNTSFPWLLMLINLGVTILLFYLIGKENKLNEITNEFPKTEEEENL